MGFNFESALFHRVAHEDENFKPRKTGWVMTFLAFVTMVALLAHEGALFHFDKTTKSQLEIHQSTDSFFNIHVNVSFPHEPCEFLEVFTTTHQSVFMLPSSKENKDIGKIMRDGICFIEGFVKVPRANGLLWIQASATAESPQFMKPNFTHTVQNFDFHDENFDKQATIAVSGWSLLSMAGMIGFDRKSMYTAGQHKKLAYSINGWTHTSPEWQPPTEDELKGDLNRPVDRYFYEINVSPQAVERQGELRWLSYKQTFTPHHSRFYLSDKDEGWGWLSHGDGDSNNVDHEFNRLATSSSTTVAFAYTLFDVATVRRKKPKNLEYFISRVLAALAGIFVLFAIGDRILTCIPALCGAKID